eukprot:362877-Chlamydomonas_euryale.AAC.4
MKQSSRLNNRIVPDVGLHVQQTSVSLIGPAGQGSIPTGISRNSGSHCHICGYKPCLAESESPSGWEWRWENGDGTSIVDFRGYVLSSSCCATRDAAVICTPCCHGRPTDWQAHLKCNFLCIDGAWLRGNACHVDTRNGRSNSDLRLPLGRTRPLHYRCASCRTLFQLPQRANCADTDLTPLSERPAQLGIRM